MPLSKCAIVMVMTAILGKHEISEEEEVARVIGVEGSNR